MKIIYEAFNFFKEKGFINLSHIISMNNNIDVIELFKFYEKEKNNKEMILFMNHYQNKYGIKSTNSNLKNKYKIGIISVNECIICYDENVVGYQSACNHFLCIECCKKYFEKNEPKKCPYCRQCIPILRINEIIKNHTVSNTIYEDIPKSYNNILRYEFLKRSNLMNQLDDSILNNIFSINYENKKFKNLYFLDEC